MKRERGVIIFHGCGGGSSPEWSDTDKNAHIGRARSLYPNAYLMDDFVAGVKEARAIIAMWNPRRSLRSLIRHVVVPAEPVVLRVSETLACDPEPKTEMELVPSRFHPGMCIERPKLMTAVVTMRRPDSEVEQGDPFGRASGPLLHEPVWPQQAA